MSTMKSVTILVSALLLSQAAAAGNQLTFITSALDKHDREYKAYIDLSSKHMEGTYTTVDLYSLWDPPVTTDGYPNIKWYKNVFQVDCTRNVKRVTYIAYIGVDGKVIVDDSNPDAPDEQFGEGTVDSMIKPYLCG